ncbi:MAG: mechanosensitive ion channel family protein [Gammaproteobacteria bacterium]|jgi:small conductance mechanosensitive channel|nr:mechanosensitive ion channel family protein [Gammaproteobacteria bacterium]
MDLIAKFTAEVNWETLMFSTLRVLFILLAAWIGLKIVRRVLRKMEQHLLLLAEKDQVSPNEQRKRVETLIRLVRQAIFIVVWVMVGLVILREFGVDIAPILASAGIVGLAVGFGAQNLVRDVISGFFMILENQVRVGDVAVVNGTGGLVEKVNFRTIVLRDLSGTVHVFPNGTINTMANLTSEWSAYVFDIGVAYKEDVDQVMELMRQVGKEMREDETFGPMMVDDVEVFGVDNFADSAVTIKGRLRTKPIKQWDVGREYRRRLKYRFDAEGIEIPFPHRSIYFGEASKPFAAQMLKSEPTAKAVSN